MEILVVDDELAIRKGLAALLEDGTYSILEYMADASSSSAVSASSATQ